MTNSCFPRLAFDLYKKASDQGDINACNNIGVCYANGFGVPKDEKLAIQHYKKAAGKHPSHQPHRPPLSENTWALQLHLIRFLISTQFRLLKVFLDEGNFSQAQFNLAMILTNGVDPKLALAYFEKSAQNGYARAQYSLGVRYEVGLEVVKDEKSAFKYFLQAADQGIVLPPPSSICLPKSL